MLPPWAIFVNLINCLIMRKLLMVLFLFGTISVFCNAQIDGYYVKDSGNLALFADGEPRTSTGDSAVFCVTDKNGDVLTITIHAY